MKKKLLGMALASVLMMAITGCGGTADSSVNAVTETSQAEESAEEKNEEEKAEEKKTEETKEAASNQTSLIADKEDKGVKSALITYDAQKLRISDETAFFLLGEMVECNSTDAIFSSPQDKRTEEYITGRFG